MHRSERDTRKNLEPIEVAENVFINPAGRVVRLGPGRPASGDAAAYLHKVARRHPGDGCIFCQPKLSEIASDIETVGAGEAFVFPSLPSYNNWNGMEITNTPSSHRLYLPERHVSGLDGYSEDEHRLRVDYIAELERAAHRKGTILLSYDRNDASVSRSQPHVHTHLIESSGRPIVYYDYNTDYGLREIEFGERLIGREAIQRAIFEHHGAEYTDMNRGETIGDIANGELEVYRSSPGAQFKFFDGQSVNEQYEIVMTDRQRSFASLTDRAIKEYFDSIQDLKIAKDAAKPGFYQEQVLPPGYSGKGFRSTLMHLGYGVLGRHSVDLRDPSSQKNVSEFIMPTDDQVREIQRRQALVAAKSSA